MSPDQGAGRVPGQWPGLHAGDAGAGGSGPAHRDRRGLGVRCTAQQRNMDKGETMRLYYAPDQPKMNQTIAVHANVMDRSGEPLHGGDVSALFTAPSGKSERVRLASEGDEWGVFGGK